MAEQRMSGRTPVIAVSLAAVALVTVVIAVIVVASRDKPASAAKPVIEDLGPIKQRVQAADVVRLDRDTLDPAGEGVKVTDAELRKTLGLGPADIITSISGRSTKRQFDVYDALLGASMMNATHLFVELVRDGKPVLLRWELDGDLRAARTATKPVPRPNPFSSSSPVTDPLLDTIKKVDDFTYELPRSTIDSVLGNPGTYSRSARVVPAFKGGVAVGLKVYAVRPGTLFHALGISSGDTIQTINGMQLDTSTAALDVQERIKGSDSIRIELTRRGRPEVLKITVTR